MKGNFCSLCNRTGVPKLTEHHLCPKEKGVKYGETISICEDCHRQIHALYTNEELALRLYTLDRLCKDEKINKYLNYVRKQPPNKKITIKKSRNVRKKAKR